MYLQRKAIEWLKKTWNIAHALFSLYTKKICQYIPKLSFCVETRWE